MMSNRHGVAGKRAGLMFAVIVATVMASSGVALAATVINCGSFEQDPLTPECYGTSSADTLEGTAAKNYIYGRGGGDTLKGFGENDQLFRQGGSDRLLGGSGVDSLYGGTGKDALRGGADIDMYYFDAGWGKDTVTDGTGPGNRVDVLSTNYEDVIVRLTSGPGPEMKNSAGTSTVNWDDNVIDTVYDGGGDDEIKGNGLPNFIHVDGSGTDTVFAGGGDDHIYAADSRVDHVDCGEVLIGGADHDEVVYDFSKDVLINCEDKTPGL